ITQYTFKEELYKRIQKSKYYILDNYNKELKIKELAEIAAISEYHFLRIFTQIIGCTPHQFLLKNRILKAKQLLKKNKTDLLTIALQCGFESSETFRKCFKRLTGTSPTQF
ncbi:helix-turn-helix domain-containing protein, partial [Bacteroidota bacterium]